MKTTLKLIAWTKMKAAVVATLLLGVGAVAVISLTTAFTTEQNDGRKTEPPKGPAATAVKPSRKVLVFRNQPSWNRKRDFEEVLGETGFQFDVKPSGDMESTDLAPYGLVIIPGSQGDDYYQDYVANASRIDRYVTTGGTLVLELNGAEGRNIVLPGNVTMIKHGAVDNLITLPDHPILTQFTGKQIHANYASHGYLQGVPRGALTLATETAGDQPALDRPTFSEYVYGKGRVIAACQCFHDRDGSKRGILMPSVVSYAVEREWYSPQSPKPAP